MANVFQLAHVAWKSELAQLLQSGIRNTFVLYAQLFGALLQEMPGQSKHILTSLAQCRQSQANDVQAVVQILAEHAFLDALLQVLVRRSNHTRTGFDSVVPTDTIKVSVAENPQQAGLQIERHVTNLV